MLIPGGSRGALQPGAGLLHLADPAGRSDDASIIGEFRSDDRDRTVGGSFATADGERRVEALQLGFESEGASSWIELVHPTREAIEDRSGGVGDVPDGAFGG